MDKTWMERAKSRMRALKMSQQALARILGMTRGAVGHYLAGRRKPDLDQIGRIADAMQVQPAWLLYGWGIVGDREPGSEYPAGPSLMIAISGDTRTGPGESGEPGGEFVSLPLAQESCYGLGVVGDDYAPRLRQGEVLLISPGQEAAPGDEVVLRLNDGSTALLHLISTSSGEAVFKQLLEADSHTVIKNDAIVLMHPIIAVIRPKLRSAGG